MTVPVTFVVTDSPGAGTYTYKARYETHDNVDNTKQLFDAGAMYMQVKGGEAVTDNEIRTRLATIAEHPDCDYTDWERAFLRAVADDHAAGRGLGSTGVCMGFYPSAVESILGNITGARAEIVAERASNGRRVSPLIDPQVSTLAAFVAQKLEMMAGRR